MVTQHIGIDRKEDSVVSDKSISTPPSPNDD
jgi:hypothetical protein